MARFRKAVLKVGSYKSPDGEVTVTPERLKHWAKEFKRLSDARQVIPIDWDHASDEAGLKPLTMDQFKKKRSAKNTVGNLADFRLSPDGQGAELTLDVADKSAADKAEKNLVYVSPVIFPTWKDGAGNEYRDCITHVDFVNHPVDHSQGPFMPAEPGAIACAIRMGLAAKPYRMMVDDEPDDKDDDDKPDGDADGDDDSEGSEEGVSDDSGRLKSVIEALGGMNIVLSEDTNTENLLAHLHQALLTAAAHRGEGVDDTDTTQNGGDKTMVADPGAAGVTALSLEARGAIAWAEKTHRDQVAGRLKKLLADGKCTPAEFKTREKETGVVKLSLDPSGKHVVLSDLEKWIDSREAVPRGTFWEPDQRLRLSAEVESPPSNMIGEMSADEAQAAANWALGRRK